MSKRLFILICILILLSGIYIYTQLLKAVYINSNVNTSVFTHIAKTIKPLDNILNYALYSCNKEHNDMKLVYENAFGSGFLKGNSIPNDLDYAVNVYLGEYDYNGVNGREIADDLLYKINLFRMNVVNEIEENPGIGFYTPLSTLDFISDYMSLKNTNLDIMTKSIEYLTDNNDYVVHVKRKLSNTIDMDFPFVLKSNEILVQNLPAIVLFTDNIQYNNKDSRFLKEMTMITDFSFTLKDERSGKSKLINVVPESFSAQRLQIYSRIFLPMIFVGESSEQYLKNSEYLKDDDYIYYRLYVYGRHLNEVNKLFNDNKSIKLAKRELQCLDLISPLIDSEKQKQIYNNSSKILNNDEIRLLNTYSNVLSNISELTQYNNVYIRALHDGKIDNMLKVADKYLNEINNADLLNKSDCKTLLNFQRELGKKIKNTNSDTELKQLNLWITKSTNKEIFPLINAKIDKLAANKQLNKEIINQFNDIYKEAGFHKINLYWIDKNTIGVNKDGFTKKIKSEDLSKMAAENRLVNVKYVFVDEKDIDNYRIRYSVWVRYDSTPEENKKWIRMQKLLIDDKSNYKIKRRFVI